MKGNRLWLLVPILLAVGLYGYSLRLPIFLDDGLHYAMIRDYGPEGIPPFRFWGGSLSYHHYRPLIFTVLELDYDIDKRFDPFALHLYSVLQFALTTAGIMALVRRLTKHVGAAIAAGCVFALYPLNVRAVTWIAANFHVNAALAIVLTLCFGLMWLDKRGGYIALLFAYLALIYGLFSQENTIFTPLFLLAAALLLYGWRAILTWRGVVLFVPLGFFAAGYLWLWFTLPRPAAGPVTFYGDMAPASLAVLSQGMAYPFVAVVRRLTLEDARTVPLLLLVAGCVVAAFGLVGRRWWPSMALALGYSFLTALPFIFFLPTDYIKGSPHVYLLPSVGLAMFWGMVIGGVYGQRRMHARWYRQSSRAILSAWVGVAVVVALAYMGARRNEALKLSDYMWRLMEILPNPTEESVLINAPAFLAALDRDRWFLTGSEATMFMEGSYTRYEYIFHAMSGETYAPITGLVYPPTFVAPPNYVFAPFWTENPQDFTARLKQFKYIIVTQFDGDNFYPLIVGRTEGQNVALTDVLDVSFGDSGIHLVAVQPTIADNIVTIPMRWRAEGPSDVTPRLTILCGDVPIVTTESAPWGGTHPFRVWEVGEVQVDIHTVVIPSRPSVDCLRLHVQLIRDGEILEGRLGDSLPQGFYTHITTDS